MTQRDYDAGIDATVKIAERVFGSAIANRHGREQNDKLDEFRRQAEQHKRAKRSGGTQ